MSGQDAYKKIRDAQKWLELPWKYRMEVSFRKGGKLGGNIDEKAITTNDALRWFIFNLDNESNKEVAIVQRQLNTFYKESGSEFKPLRASGSYDQRTASRIKHFMELYDAHLNADKDSWDALRSAAELQFYRESPFTMPRDTIDLKERLDQFNLNPESQRVLEELEMIPK